MFRKYKLDPVKAMRAMDAKKFQSPSRKTRGYKWITWIVRCILMALQKAVLLGYYHMLYMTFVICQYIWILANWNIFGYGPGEKSVGLSYAQIKNGFKCQMGWTMLDWNKHIGLKKNLIKNFLLLSNIIHQRLKFLVMHNNSSKKM